MGVTQVPSSVNRVYGLAHPNAISVSNEYAAGLVLSLMGFWNSVIYFTTSRGACKTLILRIFAGRPESGSNERRRLSDDLEPGRRSNSRWSNDTAGRGYSVWAHMAISFINSERGMKTTTNSKQKLTLQ